VPIPYFLLFLCLRKATHEIFSELDKTKAKVPIFPEALRSPKQRRRGPRRRPCHPMARATPRPHQGMVWTPSPPADATLPPIYSPRWENPKARSIFHETYCKPPPSLMRDREGPKVLSDTVPERGITVGGLLHHHAYLRSDVWVVYLGLRVHSSS
jgi:hypothetical protein